MSHDIVIRNGTLIDGTGDPGRRADVAIQGDRIVEVGDIEGTAARTIDAAGRVVTPGFVDIHTHLDAQLAWDPIGSSSCWHGVTSVVLGNCGVTFAPCKVDDRVYLAELMESVEDIPADSILSGLPWTWETYGEYLDALDALPKGLNAGGMVGHCAVRYHAMGERSLEEAPADADDLERICALVDEAIAAGALGFSTSRTYMHRVPDGRPVPGTFAAREELLAIGAVLGRRGRGVFEAALRLGERDNAELDNTRAEIECMSTLSQQSGRPVTFGLSQSYRRPTLYRRVLDFSSEGNALGAKLRPQTTGRGIGGLMGLQARTPFHAAPEWAELFDLPLAKRVAALRDPARRQRLAAAANQLDLRFDFDSLYVLDAKEPRYDCQPEDSLAAHAQRRGVSPVEAFIDLSIESEGRVLVNYPALNQSMDAVAEMLSDPMVILGLADSGAHVGQIMDASQPTWLLNYWVKERALMTLEEGIRRMTSDTAALFGIRDRGVVRPGAYADLNVIDLDGLELHSAEYVNDFPGGAGRWIQRADGYAHTLVNGRVFMENGEHTGELAGVTLRSV